MILHAFVDVEVGAGGGEASEEFIHDDQQLHIGGLGFECVFAVFNIGFGFGEFEFRLDIFEKVGLEVVVRNPFNHP